MKDCASVPIVILAIPDEILFWGVHMSGSIIRHYGVKQIAGQIKIYGDAEMFRTNPYFMSIRMMVRRISYVMQQSGARSLITPRASLLMTRNVMEQSTAMALLCSAAAVRFRLPERRNKESR